MRIPFFDCNCMLGRRGSPRPENNLSDAQILEELERAGIEGALVTHAYGKEYSPQAGNERLVEICREHRHLVPCFAVLPDGCGDFPGGDALLQYLRQGGAGAVTLYPRTHSYDLGETWCGDLWAALEGAGVPVLLDSDQASFPEMDGILRHHPRLQVIALRTGYRINRLAYPGLRIETSFYEAHRGIEEVARRFGADRLIFGTGLPQWDAGGAIAGVVYADLPEADRRRIAGEALRDLLWKGEAR